MHLTKMRPRRGILSLALFVLTSIAISGPLAAGRITGLPGGIKCADLLNNDQPICWLEIEIGKINEGTLDRIRYLLAHRDSYERKVVASAIRLNSLGGSLSAAIEIGRLVRDEKLTAIVEASAKCVSACVFVLAGAHKRIIRGEIGIHRPYFTGNASPVESVETVRRYGELIKTARAYLASMRIEGRLLDEMLRIEPRDVRYLSRTELESFGLGEGPPAKEIETLASLKEALEVKAAMAHGLSRQEYNRRSALADRHCKLDTYQSPFEPVDPADYGLSEEESEMSVRERLPTYLEMEENGWSRCYKAVMRYGR
jgi:hypothetical protein